MLPLACAWLGGGAFVASLAFCAWTYLVVWSAGASAAGGRAEIATAVALDALLVTLFATHHSLFARDAVKASLGRLVPEPLRRSFYVWVASALLAAVVWGWQRVGGEIYRLSGWLALPGIAAQLTGIWLVGRAVRSIDALELAGIRQVGARPSAQRPRTASPGRNAAAPPNPPALVVDGPYRLVRHPLYLGWVLVTLATPHMTGDRLLFAALTTAYLLVAVRWEEHALARTFGAEYTRYRREVRWRIIPYVY